MSVVHSYRRAGAPLNFYLFFKTNLQAHRDDKAVVVREPVLIERKISCKSRFAMSKLYVIVKSICSKFTEFPIYYTDDVRFILISYVKQ